MQIKRLKFVQYRADRSEGVPAAAPPQTAVPPILVAGVISIIVVLVAVSAVFVVAVVCASRVTSVGLAWFVSVLVAAPPRRSVPRVVVVIVAAAAPAVAPLVAGLKGAGANLVFAPLLAALLTLLFLLLLLVLALLVLLNLLLDVPDQSDAQGGEDQRLCVAVAVLFL